jgi:hypothetical protein
MKSVLIASALALLALTARAGEDSTHRWFGEGRPWYEDPCGLRAFSKYGDDDTPETRHAYELTKRNPELCSKLLP